MDGNNGGIYVLKPGEQLGLGKAGHGRASKGGFDAGIGQHI